MYCSDSCFLKVQYFSNVMDPDSEMVSSGGYTMQGGRWSNRKEDGGTEWCNRKVADVLGRGWCNREEAGIHREVGAV
jgi:hypothetical protein